MNLHRHKVWDLLVGCHKSSKLITNIRHEGPYMLLPNLPKALTLMNPRSLLELYVAALAFFDTRIG